MNDSVELLALIYALRREVAALKAENAALKAENAELRRRLELNSSNSSKPASSDGPGTKPRSGDKRNRSKSGKAIHLDVELYQNNKQLYLKQAFVAPLPSHSEGPNDY